MKRLPLPSLLPALTAAVLAFLSLAPRPLSADATASDPVPARFPSLTLNRPWEFYWNQHISPDQFRRPRQAPLPDAVAPPQSWQALDYPALGRATYRLVIPRRNLPQPLPPVMGLDFPSIYSAYRLYINGRLVEQVGRPAVAAAEEISRIHRTTAYFSPAPAPNRGIPPGSLEIILQVSNHAYHIRSGLTKAPRLGTKTAIERQKHLQVARDFIVIGSLMLMGFYHIILFLLRRRDRVSLYLGLFTVDVAYRRFLISGEKMAFTVFPNLTVEAFNYLQLWGIYPLLALFLLYIYRLFPAAGHRRVVIGVTAVSALYLAAAHLAAPRHSLVTPFTPVLLFGLFYILFVLFRALRQGRPEARMVGAGFLFIFAVALNDILNTLGILNSVYLLGLGLWIFLFFQALTLARRFSRAFEQVEDLSADLREKNESLQAMDRMKDEFLANTSHELKTPLNGIIGIADSLRDGAAGELTQRQDENLELIALSGQRLYALVNDILDFSSLKNNTLKLDIRPVSLRGVINIVTAITRPMTRQKGLDLRLEVPEDIPGVMADPGRLQQILFNLTGNALKFTVDGALTLRAEAAPSAGKVVVSVIDTGIGIDAEKQEAIFESFSQADGSISRRFGGTGLGLSITKSLLERQGGTITVDSTPGEGSVFRFTLPAAPPEAALEEADSEAAAKSAAARRRVFSDTDLLEEPNPPDAPAASAPGTPGAPAAPDTEPQGYTILVVDDEAVNLQVLINQLSLYDYRTVTAASGPEALAKLREGLQPDAAILDVMMPEMSGYDLAREIRKTYGPSELPILLLTAKDQTQDILQGFDSGANDYLTKPFSRAELIARVRTHTQLCKITLAYSRFVPREFLEILDRESITDVQLGDHTEKDMTVLFADIRSFTSLSENLTPEENFRFINSFLGRFGPLIRSNNGFVDKYVGDEIMALFPGSPADALAAADAMRQERLTYNRHRASLDYPAIDFGIGIHAGTLMMGTVGEAERMDTTVIADIVNTAARLEALTKALQAPVLTTREALAAAQTAAGTAAGTAEPPNRPLGEALVRGRREAVPIVEILTDQTDPVCRQKTADAPRFAQALAHYLDQNFSEAYQLFEEILSRNPEDRAAALYTERSRAHQKTAPQELPPRWRYLEQ